MSNIPDFGRQPARFVSGPSEALQFKLAAVEMVRKLRPSAGRELDCFWKDDVQWQDDHRVLVAAPVFYWTDQTAKLVSAAAETYQLQNPLYVPTIMHALSVFAGPTLSIEIDGTRTDLSALLWSFFLHHRTQKFLMRYVGFKRENGVPPAAVICGTFPKPPWVEGDWQSVDEDIQLFTKWVCSASAFVEQRILAAGTHHPERQLRKHAQRLQIESMVNTVQLRRTEHRESELGGHESHREYNCQWIVSGHWRKQWHPKAGRHVPTWITPYVKGPEDKPLKVPTQTVFAVTR